MYYVRKCMVEIKLETLLNKERYAHVFLGKDGVVSKLLIDKDMVYSGEYFNFDKIETVSLKGVFKGSNSAKEVSDIYSFIFRNSKSFSFALDCVHLGYLEKNNDVVNAVSSCIKLNDYERNQASILSDIAIELKDCSDAHASLAENEIIYRTNLMQIGELLFSDKINYLSKQKINDYLNSLDGFEYLTWAKNDFNFSSESERNHSKIKNYLHSQPPREFAAL